MGGYGSTKNTKYLEYSMSIPWIFNEYTFDIFWVYAEHTINIPWLHLSYTLNITSLYLDYTLSTNNETKYQSTAVCANSVLVWHLDEFTHLGLSFNNAQFSVSVHRVPSDALQSREKRYLACFLQLVFATANLSLINKVSNFGYL